MQLHDTLHMLLGAALVAAGVLITALADYIRGLRAQRQVAQVPRSTRAGRIEVVDAEIVEDGPPVPKLRTPRVRPGDVVAGKANDAVAGNTNDAGDANDVINALVAAGYKKAVATEAAWGCTQAERATPESWTRAALRRARTGCAS